jgi:uncharacterized protein YcbX
MAGERVPAAELHADGIVGDRQIQVHDARGRVATSRTYPGLLGLHATIVSANAPDQQVLVDGLPWDHPTVLASVRAIVGPGAKLVRSDIGTNEDSRFDILPLLVATDGAIAAFGRDVRRLRPNIVIGGVEGLAERTWEGSDLLIGDVRIGIHDLRGRCIMTTFDPDTLAHDPTVLRDIVKRFAGKLALNCEVLQPGRMEVGQPVTLVRPA